MRDQQHVERGRRRGIAAFVPVAGLMTVLAVVPIAAWGPQAHRLVARVADTQLNAIARQQVTSLLDGATLADVSTWADEIVDSMRQTAPWHYVNIPAAAARYDRDRDCPRQPATAARSRADRWRDCIVDRILFNEQRLADTTLDRADRAVALKFLVHFVADIHQPFHALGEERGGNGIFVNVFGSSNCGSRGRDVPCNLHAVWDSGLITRRRLNDDRYLALLQRLIEVRGRTANAGGPAEWAKESHDAARAALLANHGAVDQAYFEKQIGVVDERLAMGGLRLAALLNRSLTAPTRR